jgi:hypothetical protein
MAFLEQRTFKVYNIRNERLDFPIDYRVVFAGERGTGLYLPAPDEVIK